jgi:hypothetical protein
MLSIVCFTLWRFLVSPKAPLALRLMETADAAFGVVYR